MRVGPLLLVVTGLLAIVGAIYAGVTLVNAQAVMDPFAGTPWYDTWIVIGCVAVLGVSLFCAGLWLARRANKE